MCLLSVFNAYLRVITPISIDREETRTHRKSLSVMLRGFFVYIQQVKTNPLKYRILHL